MIRKQEKIRRNNVYQATKQRIADKPYNKKITNVFAEVAEAFGYEPRSVSNIYYALRKAEEKQLHQIRVSKAEGRAIAQWFKDNVTKWHQLDVDATSDNEYKGSFSVNEPAKQGEYSFDFYVSAKFNVQKFGKGITEPVDEVVFLQSYSVELTGAFNYDGEELILQQKYIQEIEDHLYSVLKLEITYNG